MKILIGAMVITFLFVESAGAEIRCEVRPDYLGGYTTICREISPTYRSTNRAPSLEDTGSAIWRALSNKSTFGDELNAPYRPSIETRCETHPDYLGGYRTVCRTR